MKKYIIYLLIVIGILLGVLSLRVLLAEDKYISVEIIASGGDWWETLPKTPYWLADSVVPGIVEYSIGGKKIAEVLETKKYDEDSNKILWARVRLLVTPDKTSKGWRFRQMPLNIGSTLTIEPNNINLAGSVISIEGVGQSGIYRNISLTVKLIDRFPWYADAIPIGLKVVDDQGGEIAEILDKKIILSEIMVQTSDGRVLLRQNPLKRDIILSLKIQVVERNGQVYFNQVQSVKIGKSLWIQTPRLNLWDANIMKVEGFF